MSTSNAAASVLEQPLEDGFLIFDKDGAHWSNYHGTDPVPVGSTALAAVPEPAASTLPTAVPVEQVPPAGAGYILSPLDPAVLLIRDGVPKTWNRAEGRFVQLGSAHLALLASVCSEVELDEVAGDAIQRAMVIALNRLNLIELTAPAQPPAPADEPDEPVVEESVPAGTGAEHHGAMAGSPSDAEAIDAPVAPAPPPEMRLQARLRRRARRELGGARHWLAARAAGARAGWRGEPVEEIAVLTAALPENEQAPLPPQVDVAPEPAADPAGTAQPPAAPEAQVPSGRHGEAATEPLLPAATEGGAAPAPVEAAVLHDELASSANGAVPDTSAEDGAEQEADEAAPARPMFSDDPRVPVIPIYHSQMQLQDVPLSLGDILAYLRAYEGGSLNDTYNLVRPRLNVRAFIDELRTSGRPAVIIFSNYLWSTERNLALSAEAKEINPKTITIHGGPNTPRNPRDVEQFMVDNPHVDVMIRNEGEATMAEALAAIAANPDPADLSTLGGVTGLSFRQVTAGGAWEAVRTPDRPRLAELDEIPSPYLTGEYADFDPSQWWQATVETNRGCPYACAFCDWGQATKSRIRKFSMERVKAELDWLAEHKVPEVFIADANFGILPRDIEIAEYVADLTRTTGYPKSITVCYAKNGAKHLEQIITAWVDVGIISNGSVALQTTDEVTLANIDRKNIKVEKYDELTEVFRSLNLPIITDLLMGMPGATVEAFKNDLQRCFDLEVMPRVFEVEMLPNAPMNEPAYRKKFQIELSPYNTICGASTYTHEDFLEMKRLRFVFRTMESYGLMRHILRWLQAERDLPALEVLHELDRQLEADPSRYPLLAYSCRLLDVYTVPPIGWDPYYDEVAAFLHDTYGIERDPVLETLIEVQKAIMPDYGRTFPCTVRLDHDYVAYYRSLPHPGQEVEGPLRPLAEYGPGTLTVTDPYNVSGEQVGHAIFRDRRDNASDNLFYTHAHWELGSELARSFTGSVYAPAGERGDDAARPSFAAGQLVVS